MAVFDGTSANSVLKTSSRLCGQLLNLTMLLLLQRSSSLRLLLVVQTLEHTDGAIGLLQALAASADQIGSLAEL